MAEGTDVLDPQSADAVGGLRLFMNLLKPKWVSRWDWRIVVTSVLLLFLGGGYFLGSRFWDPEPVVLTSTQLDETSAQTVRSEAPVVEDASSVPSAASVDEVTAEIPEMNPAVIADADDDHPATEPADASVDVEQGSAEVPDAESAIAFAGTIRSDNGWFTITVAADGEASGTLAVSFPLDGGKVDQTGVFAGAIYDDNVVSCFGVFQGVSTDAEGHEFPHNGTVEIRAVPKPTTEDLTAWEITANGEPGDVVVLTAHAN